MHTFGQPSGHKHEHSRLPGPARLGWLLAHIGLGILPSALFFVWVERNASLPLLPLELGWPWFYLETESLWMRSAFNAALFFGFGALHSLLAQPFVHHALQRFTPPQAVRSLYIIVTGISLLALMGLWQHTGQVLWVAPLSPLLLNSISFLTFWLLLAAAGRQASRFDAWEFIGLRQLYQKRNDVGRSEGTPKLIQSGIYSWVRHPIYLFTLSAVLVTPFMTLDRMVLFLAMMIYLIPGIAIEEHKLVTLFGDDYHRYRARVPAILPLPGPIARAFGLSRL